VPLAPKLLLPKLLPNLLPLALKLLDALVLAASTVSKEESLLGLSHPLRSTTFLLPGSTTPKFAMIAATMGHLPTPLPKSKNTFASGLILPQKT
jgi:hypothetical protein